MHQLSDFLVDKNQLISLDLGIFEIFWNMVTRSASNFYDFVELHGQEKDGSGPPSWRFSSKTHLTEKASTPHSTRVNLQLHKAISSDSPPDGKSVDPPSWRFPSKPPDEKASTPIPSKSTVFRQIVSTRKLSGSVPRVSCTQCDSTTKKINACLRDPPFR